jgi:hypothetical protein
MKMLSPSSLLTCAIAFAGLVAAQAQSTPAFAIKKIEPSFVESPQIQAPTYRKQSQGRSTPWLEVEITFDHDEKPLGKSDPKFSEDITINYYILLNNENEAPDRRRTLLTGTVTHADVPYGTKGLRSVVYVSPQTLTRYFNGKLPSNTLQALVDVGASISDKGTVVAISSWKSKLTGDKGWWEDASTVTTVPNRVLNKNQTPFAHLSWDYHLPPKPGSDK